MGLCKALSQLGIRCPEDVSVVGFDDIKFCENFSVPLTTIRVPKFDMGNIAAQMLIRHIESQKSVTPQKVYLDATLIVRSSTAPPASADSRSITATTATENSRIHRLQSATNLTAAQPAESGGHPQPR
jgi:hypothetical protein